MIEVQHRPDVPEGELIDDLVADIIDSANRHVRIAADDMERLTSYPTLAERYGDFNLGLNFQGAGGRLLRKDIHQRLRDKGLSQRQIAAVTGSSPRTIRRDRDGADAPPRDREDGADATPDQDAASLRDKALTQEQRDVEAMAREMVKRAKAWVVLIRTIQELKPEAIVPRLEPSQLPSLRMQIQATEEWLADIKRYLKPGLRAVEKGT